jgi:hypothetical protein
VSYDLAPFDLAWAEVDPRLNPFDGSSALVEVTALGPARRVPARPAGHAADRTVISWSHDAGRAWTEAMTHALVERFGRWVVGWRWAHDEGDIGGGPVGSWCCPRDSITSPEATLAKVAAALCEWRAWLEDLAERFDRYPLDSAPPEDRQDLWERAAVHLVTHVVERTGAGDAWYGHCEQVLSWFLTRWGVPADTAQALVEEAIGGRFESWTGPEPALLGDVAQRLALSLAEADGA